MPVPARLVWPIGWKARARLRMPVPNTASVPGVPASSALRNKMSTICAPVRFGKALASRAAAPLITGAEKEVPENRNESPVWSNDRTR